AILLVMRASATNNNCRVSVEIDGAEEKDVYAYVLLFCILQSNKPPQNLGWEKKAFVSGGKQGESAAAIYRSQWM
ncbi:MAG: hypothetical protein ACLVJZ_06470, partial [[Clostridium] leptum]